MARLFRNAWRRSVLSAKSGEGERPLRTHQVRNGNRGRGVERKGKVVDPDHAIRRAGRDGFPGRGDFWGGQLNRPKLPDIPGVDAFGGASFHSAKWDHSVDMNGKTVGVIGTGAS